MLPPRVSLPHTGSVLANIVQVQIEGGLLDFGRYLREVTVRSDIVIRLILKKKDEGHPDYQHLDEGDVRARAQ